MDLARKMELLQQQIVDARNGNPADFNQWRDKTDVVLRTVIGINTPLHNRFKNTKYVPSMWTENTDFRPFRAAGVQKVVSILEAAKTELTLAAEVADTVQPSEEATAAEPGRQVFIVHGGDNAAKHELARLLRGLTGSEPVILHEQPNEGRVLIEKFESSAADTGFAIALLTADDVGRVATSDPTEDRKRARQNVVFELGFFFGAIGRKRTAVLYDEGVELPSDVQGLVYILRDDAGGWKTALARELAAVGIPVEWSALAHA